MTLGGGGTFAAGKEKTQDSDQWRGHLPSGRFGSDSAYVQARTEDKRVDGWLIMDRAHQTGVVAGN